MRLQLSFFLLAILCLVPACSPVSYEGKQALEEPVDCMTAEQDMKTLEDERASVAKQIVVGASNIIPVGAVVRLLRGQWTEGAKVAVGDYNARLEQKMREIHRYCGTPLPEGFE